MGSYRISIQIQSFEALKWILMGDQMEICGRRMTIGVFENQRTERARERLTMIYLWIVLLLILNLYNSKGYFLKTSVTKKLFLKKKKIKNTIEVKINKLRVQNLNFE
jgi:hypothetical protein